MKRAAATAVVLATLAFVSTGCRERRSPPGAPARAARNETGPARAVAPGDGAGARPAAEAGVAAPPEAAGRGSGPGDFVRLAAQVRPSMVNIFAHSRRAPRHPRVEMLPFGEHDEPDAPEPEEPPPHAGTHSRGSGFLVDTDGHILTNDHVLGDADDVRVQLWNETELPARIVGRDPSTDIALLRVNLPKDAARPAALGDSDALEVGEWVLAIGHPFGLTNTVTAGIVSAKGRSIPPAVELAPDLPTYWSFIQTDAKINPGNSGGPLVNLRGEVVGINTLVNRVGKGIGFAIPINMAKALLPDLKKHGRPQRSWLGIYIQPVEPLMAAQLGLVRPRGALVSEVVPGGPAEEAGIQSGDVLLRFDGKPIRRAKELPWIAATAGIGREVDVVLWRAGRELTVRLRTAPMPAPASSPQASAPSRESRP